jgi:hypothetical protein
MSMSATAATRRHRRDRDPYRPRSAIREVGKALGLTEDVTAGSPTRLGQLGHEMGQRCTSARPGSIRRTRTILRAIGFARSCSASRAICRSMSAASC